MARKSRLNVLLLIACLTLSLLAATVFAQEEWGYEGDTGPDAWGDVSAVCGEGASQSPVNIADAAQTSLTPIEFHYEAVPLAIFNNGHTIEVEYHEGSSIVYNEKTYNVLQFHFHQPSEHTIDGETFPMELHIVHQNPVTGGLAVVGVMLQEGETNEAYSAVFDNLPPEESEPDEATELTISAADLLPEHTDAYFTYEGSLTTPPCSEIVRWLVLAEPVTLSAEQIAAFGAIYDNNARPVQPLNTRDLFTNAG